MRFEFYGDARGEWRWRLLAGNGEIVADSSEGYTTKHGARRAVLRFVTGVRDAMIVTA